MKALSEEKVKARDLILKAAQAVFAAHGVKGATTREIVRVAGVNETTLFRNFQTKEALLKAVVESAVSDILTMMSDPGNWTYDLRADLLHYATVYEAMLAQNEPLIRMFIGEAQRQPENANLVILSVVQPIRQKLIEYFEAHQQRGNIREDILLPAVVDAFTGMLLSGMLRRQVLQQAYSEKAYRETSVELLVQGLEPPRVDKNHG